MFRVIIISILLFTSSFVFANNDPVKHTISGIVVDSNTNEPITYATVSLHQGDKIIDGVITDEKGAFQLKIRKGNYTLKVEFLSYNTYQQELTVTNVTNLGTIALSEASELLDEIAVRAEKSSVRLKVDKKVFNVGKDLLSQSGSLTDVLENVPSVSVDLEGAVSLRGNQNVSILINGKPSVLTANNGLSQIPAEQIDRIEVITNPSSRYQASGTSGIINVILKKNKSNGLNGAITISNSVRADVNANASFNYKTEKLNLFSTIGYRFVDNKYIGDDIQNSIVNNNPILLDRKVNTYRNFDAKNIYFGFDYFLNEYSTLTASYYKILIDRNNRVHYNYDYYDAFKSLDSTIVRDEAYHEPMNHNQLELSYTKNYKKEGKKLVIDFQYDFWDDDENERFSTQKIFPSLDPVVLSRTRDIESSKDYLLQIDFVNPLENNNSFETGLRGESRIISSEYKAEALNNNQWEIINNIDNKLDYKEKIGGVYALYAGKKDKVSYQFGLRTEYTNIEILDKKGEFKDTKNYTNFFPTVHLNYTLSDKTNTQISYSRRINRPSFWHLNPFGGLAGINAQMQGNPDMDPALTNSLELGLLTTVGKLQINPSVYYQNTKDVFQFFTERNEDDVLITKPINIDSENRVGLELSMIYSPIEWMRLSGEINYFTFKQNGSYKHTNYDFDNSSWFGRINTRIKLPAKYTFQANFNYNARNENAQTLRRANYFLDLGVNKSFLNNKLAITFNARNILNSRERQTVITGDQFIYESNNKLLGPKYTLTAIYRFNQKGKAKTRRPGQSNR